MPAIPMETPLRKIAYDIFLTFWRMVLTIFFREIRPRGAFNIPRDGPVILVAAPHHNQFLDPLLLMSETYRESGRRVHCLAAAKSIKRKVVGFFITMQGSIPVSRAADDARPGKGLIRLSDDDPLLIIGSGTQFTKELSPKMQIMLPKSVNSAAAEVLEILSDTSLRIKREFGGESGRRTVRFRERVAESNALGLEYKVLPYVDQGVLYSQVYQCLKEGGCIGIFPEGGSHDRSDLLPLKAGVSMMALGAMASDPALKVKIVPVGLSYFHPHRFRSRAVVEFGSAMDVPSEFVNLFKQGGDQKRDACGKLLNMIYDGLKTVTLRAPDYDTLMLIQAARRLYKTPGQHLTLGQVVELNKRFMEGYEHFKDEPRVQLLRANVLRYNRLVRDLGLRDHQVPRATKATWKILGLTLYRTGLLLAWSLLALPGFILNSPIFLSAKIISRRKAKEALAASTVKIEGRDVLATWKVLVSLGLAPVLYAIYGLLAFVIARKANASFKWQVLAPIAMVLSLPLVGFGALKFGEAGIDILKSLRPLVVSLVPGQQRHLLLLKRMRTELSNELADVVNEYGPKLYDDFDQWRILVPSASVPASGETSGLWRRRTNVGAFDAQGSLLVHPMTWLDERLFGWSKSSKRGTSAWAESYSDSAESSRQHTPDTSDHEDVGDYDDIMGLLHTNETAPTESKLRPKSTRSSYADLQQLRMSEKDDDNTTRTSPRQRRASLSGDVSVGRLARIDRNETFNDATEDINKENILAHPEKRI